MAALLAKTRNTALILTNAFSRSSKRHFASSLHHIRDTCKRCIQRHSSPLLYSKYLKDSRFNLGAKCFSSDPGDVIRADSLTTTQSDLLTDTISNSSEALINSSHVLNSLGEPTLTSLGLGGYSPIGLVQQYLELIHTSCDISWSWSIIVATIGLRLLVFPLRAYGQANMARLNNVKPQVDKLKRDVEQANDWLTEKAAANARLQEFLVKNNCHPFKALSTIALQAPIFISFFFGLRRMAELPVESLKTGGMLWFQDLTVFDPYYVLPVLCGATMLISLELGGEAAVSMSKQHKMFMRFVPLIVIAAMSQFPAAMTVYWVTSFTLSVAQLGLLKLKIVKDIFGIPESIDWDKQPLHGVVNVSMTQDYKPARNNKPTAKTYKDIKRRRKQKAEQNESEGPHKPLIKYNQQTFSNLERNKSKNKV